MAVADGFGPAGDRASAAAIDALRTLDSGSPEPSRALGEVAGSGASGDAVPADLLNLLSDAVSAADASVRSITQTRPDLAGSGATLTAMLLSGSRLALVHIGDTRAYLFRDGGLFQITHDHSVTQSMIDSGRAHPGGGGIAPAALHAAARGRRVQRGDGGVGAAGGAGAHGRARLTCRCSRRGTATGTCSPRTA